VTAPVLRGAMAWGALVAGGAHLRGQGVSTMKTGARPSRRAPVASLAIVWCVVSGVCLQQTGRALTVIPGEPVAVAGRVLDAQGRPAPGIKVGAVQRGVYWSGFSKPSTLDSLYTTTTDEQGAFGLTLWGIKEEPPEFGAWSIWARDEAGALMGGMTIRTTPAQPLEISLAPASYIHSTAVDAEGRPIPGIRTWVGAAQVVGPAVGGPSTDEQGAVLVGPLPAGVPLHIFTTSTVRFLSLNGDWWELGQPEITLTPGETRELPPLRVGVAQRTLGGVVEDRNGDPVAGARVSTFAPSAFPVATTADADGHFALTGLLPTKEDLWIVASDGTARTHVALKTGPEATTCRLTLRAPAYVIGQLAGADGRPLEGTPVYADRLMLLGDGKTDQSWRAEGLPAVEQAKTDAQGFFAIGGLVSGAPYRVCVEAQDVHFGMWRMAFTADADGVTDLGLVMSDW